MRVVLLPRAFTDLNLLIARDLAASDKGNALKDKIRILHLGLNNYINSIKNRSY